MNEYYKYWKPESLEAEKLRSFALNYVSKKGGEVKSIRVMTSTTQCDLIQIKYDTATEAQKKYGYFTTHEHKCLLSKLPKKYSVL